MIKQIPNIFTLANLFFGCCAIVFTLQSNNTLVHIENYEHIILLPEKIWFASLFIGVATIMDFLDGLVARYLKVTSELGKQLDSLSDVVSFGVAPAIILYQMLRIAFSSYFTALDFNWFFLSPAFLIACFAAYRLGKFNLDTAQSNYFIGMPTPIVGIFVASLPLVMWTNQLHLNNILLNIWFLYALIFILCYLMVCNKKFIALKFKKPLIQNTMSLSVILVFIICVILFNLAGISVAVIIYIILSLLLQKKIV